MNRFSIEYLLRSSCAKEQMGRSQRSRSLLALLAFFLFLFFLCCALQDNVRAKAGLIKQEPTTINKLFCPPGGQTPLGSADTKHTSSKQRQGVLWAIRADCFQIRLFFHISFSFLCKSKTRLRDSHLLFILCLMFGTSARTLKLCILWHDLTSDWRIVFHSVKALVVALGDKGRNLSQTKRTEFECLKINLYCDVIMSNLVDINIYLFS